MQDYLHLDPLLLHGLLHVHAAGVAAHVLAGRLRGQKGEKAKRVYIPRPPPLAATLNATQGLINVGKYADKVRATARGARNQHARSV